MLTLALSAVTAVCLDWWLGEPRRWHPLVGFGSLANGIENRWNSGTDQQKKIQGIFALLLLLTPFVFVSAWLSSLPVVGTTFAVLALYFAIGHKSLHEHAEPVAQALLAGDEDAARAQVSLMVSRDSAAIDPIPATIESVLENGNDGLFGALFWFMVAGAPGAILYRLANTLDAMWGYKTPRFLQFGWSAARFDDLLNYLPARLTALTYAMLGHFSQALHCWHTQAPLWDSPNAGPVMAAGAGALGVRLGGPARYQGEWHQRPTLGCGAAPTLNDIGRALSLVRHGLYGWLILLLFVGWIQHA